MSHMYHSGDRSSANINGPTRRNGAGHSFRRGVPPEHDWLSGPFEERMNPGSDRLMGIAPHAPRLFSTWGERGRVRPKLRINPPNDRFEQEADRVAEQVARVPMTPAGERHAPDISTTHEPSVQTKCAECEKEKDEKHLQRKALDGANADSPSAIERHTGISGVGMAPGVRSFMERQFGHDFGEVRIHNDGAAAESARAINARAYTVGRDVVFGAGEYKPESSDGRKLLAHELTHVVQQGSSGTMLQRTACEQDSARFGGNIAHQMFGWDYVLNLNPGLGRREYEIPLASKNLPGVGSGYADIVNLGIPHEIYDFKSYGVADEGIIDVMHYIQFAQQHCDPSIPWVPGTNYPGNGQTQRILPDLLDPKYEWVAQQDFTESPQGGLILYWRRLRRNPDPNYAPVPQEELDRLRDKVKAPKGKPLPSPVMPNPVTPPIALPPVGAPPIGLPPVGTPPVWKPYPELPPIVRNHPSVGPLPEPTSDNTALWVIGGIVVVIVAILLLPEELIAAAIATVAAAVIELAELALGLLTRALPALAATPAFAGEVGSTSGSGSGVETNGHGGSDSVPAQPIEQQLLQARQLEQGVRKLKGLVDTDTRFSGMRATVDALDEKAQTARNMVEALSQRANATNSGTQPTPSPSNPGKGREPISHSNASRAKPGSGASEEKKRDTKDQIVQVPSRVAGAVGAPIGTTTMVSIQPNKLDLANARAGSTVIVSFGYLKGTTTYNSDVAFTISEYHAGSPGSAHTATLTLNASSDINIAPVDASYFLLLLHGGTISVEYTIAKGRTTITKQNHSGLFVP